MMRSWILGFLSMALASSTQAQGKFDGTWTGTAGDWTLALTVTGTKAKLKMACAGQSWDFDVPVSATGTVDTYVRAPDFARRQITGQLPAINVPPGGSCRGGSTNLSR
jgi:hypothetical protein